MKKYNFLSILVLFMSITGCATAQNTTTKLPTAYALEGTRTAVVGIAVDKKGVPKETVKQIVLNPGQKVIFAGPDKFLISFKNNKTPDEKGRMRFESKNGVVSLYIPTDILEKKEYQDEYKRDRQVRFDYSIFVNGRELDPPIILRKEN
jgi:hypothetical protein